MLAELGVKDMSLEDVQTIIREIDEDGDMMLDKEEFAHLMQAHIGNLDD